MQTLANDVLHNDINVLISLEGLCKFNNAFVVQLLHEHYLSAHTLSAMFIHQLRLVVNLSCKVLPCLSFSCGPYHSVGPFSQLLAEGIILVYLFRAPVSAHLRRVLVCV